MDNFGAAPIAERRILVRTLPIEVVRCREGRVLNLKLVIFIVMITFLDSIDLVWAQGCFLLYLETRELHENLILKRKLRLNNYLKVTLARPRQLATSTEGREVKILLSAIYYLLFVLESLLNVYCRVIHFFHKCQFSWHLSTFLRIWDPQSPKMSILEQSEVVCLCNKGHLFCVL